MKKLLTGAVLTVLSAAPLEAASVLDPYLGNPGDCYARKYDEAHLHEHPRQIVETFYLSHHDGWHDPAGELTLKFGFSTRNGRDYDGVAICNDRRCGVEGDGGAFSPSRPAAMAYGSMSTRSWAYGRKAQSTSSISAKPTIRCSCSTRRAARPVSDFGRLGSAQ